MPPEDSKRAGQAAASNNRPGPSSAGTTLASALLGFFLALSLIKFGNPVVLDKMVEVPGDVAGLIFQPWPARWGHALFVLVAVLVAWLCRSWWSVPKGIAWMPLVWLVWQGIAGAATIDPIMTKAMLVHFTVAVACYYLGYCCLRDSRSRVALTLPLLLGFGYALWVGMDQHFGGLAASRRQFYETTPNWQQFPAEFIKKVNSDRIFSTLVYPNALAGAVLLFLPVLGAFVWELLRERKRLFGLVGLGGLIYGGAACMIWSGSKGGWLIALLVLGIIALRQPLRAWMKWTLVGVVFAGGLGFFGWRYQGYFSKGATSVGARFDYWEAAGKNVAQRPWLGSGPGTYAQVYARVKRPESEMARLTHNDYLQQASDSGIPGSIFYLMIFPLGLVLLWRGCWNSDLHFWHWIALLGWSVQSLMEFGLYIPALAWTAFVWLGWLVREWQGAERRDPVSSH